MDKEFEDQAFLDLFPNGIGEIYTTGRRDTKLYLRRHGNQRLLKIDFRFPRNAEYILSM